MTTLTPAEQSAIAAFKGPITKCPPMTFTPSEQIQPASKRGRAMMSNAHQRSREKGESTRRMIHELRGLGWTASEIARQSGLRIETVMGYLE